MKTMVSVGGRGWTDSKPEQLEAGPEPSPPALENKATGILMKKESSHFLLHLLSCM